MNSVQNIQFKTSDYLFTPGDCIRLAREFWRGLKTLGFRDGIGLALLAGVALALRLSMGFGLEAIYFWVCAVAVVYWRLDARLPIGAALACLVTIPVLLLLYNQNILFTGDAWAERVAVWAYFFLVIGVAKQLFDLQVARHRTDTKPSPMYDPAGYITPISLEPEILPLPGVPEPVPLEKPEPAFTMQQKPVGEEPKSAPIAEPESTHPPIGVQQHKKRGWRDRNRWSLREYTYLKPKRHGDRLVGRGVIDLREAGGSANSGRRLKDLSQYVVNLANES